MSKTPVNWETFRTNVFTDQKARDSGITSQDWEDAMNQLGLERIALQEVDEWHDEVGEELVTYEFSRTVGQPGVINRNNSSQQPSNNRATFQPDYPGHAGHRDHRARRDAGGLWALRGSPRNTEHRENHPGHRNRLCHRGLPASLST